MMSVDVGSSPSVPRGLVWEGGGGDGVVTPVKIIAGFAEWWRRYVGGFRGVLWMVGVEEGWFIVWGGVPLYTRAQISIDSSSAREGLGSRG